MKNLTNSVDCEICEFANSKICDKCIEDNTFINITELKNILKKATNIKEYRKEISRSWGDCNPDYEEVKFNYIDIDEMNKFINKLTKK